MKIWLLVAATAAMAAVLACSGGDDAASPTPTAEPTPTRTPVDVPITDEITVFAASSLTEVLTQVAEDYEHLRPGYGVNLVFGGSQELRARLEQGEQADIFIAADRHEMDAAAQTGMLSGQRHIVARNKLVVIVPRTNEAAINRLEDLAKPGVKISIGDEGVPVGRYARLFLQAASASGDFTPSFERDTLNNAVSQTASVKGIVAAVQSGEADAGIVYATDVTRDVADEVTVIDIPTELNQEVIYTASLTYSGVFGSAQDFIDYLIDPDGGRPTLESFGFLEGN